MVSLTLQNSYNKYINPNIDNKLLIKGSANNGKLILVKLIASNTIINHSTNNSNMVKYSLLTIDTKINPRFNITDLHNYINDKDCVIFFDNFSSFISNNKDTEYMLSFFNFIKYLYGISNHHYFIIFGDDEDFPLIDSVLYKNNTNPLQIATISLPYPQESELDTIYETILYNITSKLDIVYSEYLNININSYQIWEENNISTKVKEYLINKCNQCTLLETINFIYSMVKPIVIQFISKCI